jgi:ketosteroid isomerase-like protein
MEELVRRTWAAISDGDLGALERVLAADAHWRAVEEGPWNCESRAEIVEVMRRNLADGLQGKVEQVIELGDRAIVAFRPDHHHAGGWPLENGIRYIVLTASDGLITEMKACATRKEAEAYAATPVAS